MLVSNEFTEMLKKRAGELDIEPIELLNSALRFISILEEEELRMFVDDMAESSSCGRTDRPCCGGGCQS